MTKEISAEDRLKKELKGRKQWENYDPHHELLFTMEITNQCTLRCKHCFANASPYNNTFISADLIEQRAEGIVELFQRYPLKRENTGLIKYFLNHPLCMKQRRVFISKTGAEYTLYLADIFQLVFECAHTMQVFI